MAKQTTVATTTGGVWTTLVSGECTVAALVANATVDSTLVSLRVTLTGGTFSYILPLNTLPLNTPARLAVGGISLKTGDKLEAMSSTSVQWMTTTITGAAYSSAIVTSPSNEAWTTLKTGPATVRALFLSAPSGGSFGVRLHKTTSDTSIVLSEELTAGGSKRLMVPVVLAATESIQVKGTATAYWIATGVE
jgi:hypothetical protein